MATQATRPTVTVWTPCTCGASKWFNCGCSHMVARYECDPASEDYRWEPHPIHISEIERRHPGMDLIYYQEV